MGPLFSLFAAGTASSIQSPIAAPKNSYVVEASKYKDMTVSLPTRGVVDEREAEQSLRFVGQFVDGFVLRGPWIGTQQAANNPFMAYTRDYHLHVHKNDYYFDDVVRMVVGNARRLNYECERVGEDEIVCRAKQAAVQRAVESS